jgi:hypothetical protein
MDKQSLTRRAALGLIASGGTLLVSESLAFTQIRASRESNIDTSRDANALLGLVDTSGTAEVSGEDDTATVYEVTDNIGSLSESDIDVSVVKLIARDGTETAAPPVEATVRNTGAGQFDVDISCTSETDNFGDSYQVVLDFVATTDNTSVTATRRTSPTSYVNISCTFDYGDSGNYRDDDSGDASQPTDPSGTIENPSGVNDNDGTTATAISVGNEEDLKVGYALPPVDKIATEYEIIFDIERIQIGRGSGTFGFYLVNESGEELTNRQSLPTKVKGSKSYSYSFTESEEQDIVANYDNLYLILDSDTNGNGNRKLEIDYFELKSA